eukprot:3262976-Prymnesium_polylepis.1
MSTRTCGHAERRGAPPPAGPSERAHVWGGGTRRAVGTCCVRDVPRWERALFGTRCAGARVPGGPGVPGAGCRVPGAACR